MPVLDVEGVTVGRYNGNPKLKACHVKIPFTKKQVDEYAKCQNDIVYFAETYIKLVTLDYGLVNVTLYPFQKKMLKDFQLHRFNIGKIGRQSGKSTICWIALLWECLFEEEYSIAIISKTEKSAKTILARLKKAYETLPLWLQQGVEAWNVKSIEFENGNRVEVMTSVRGESINHIFLDEYAHVPKATADEMMEDLIPAVSAGTKTKMTIVSTPNGQNHYYHEWMRAINGESGFNAIDVHWTEVPGRGDEWAEEMRALLGDAKFDQEILCSFMGSIGSLIPSSVLTKVHHQKPLHSNDHLSVWEDCNPKNKYFISCDVSHGKGLDYSVFHVIDVTKYPFKQVAVFRDNNISPHHLPHQLLQVGIKYNSCPIVIENNDIGSQVAYILQYELEYPNVFGTYSGGKHEYGLRQTKKTKSMGCAVFRDLMETEKLILNDKDTIDELTVFVQHGEGDNIRYAAEQGMHDDCVMGLVIFSYMTTQNYFKEETEKDFAQKMGDEYQSQLEEELPVGFFNDGATNGDNEYDDGDGMPNGGSFQKWLLG